MPTEPKTTKPKKSPPIFFLCLFLFGIPAGACAWQGDYVFAALIGLAGLGCFIGFKGGIARTLASVAGVAAAVWFTDQIVVSQEIEYRMSQLAGTTGLTNRLLAYAAIGLAIFFIATFVLSLISRWIMRRNPSVESLNRGVGFILGGAAAVVGVVTLLGGLITVRPLLPTVVALDAPVQHTISTSIEQVVDHTEGSYVGPWIEQFNPFTQFPQLNYFAQAQSTFAILRDADALKQIINDPRMQETPEIQGAIEELLSNEDMKAVLESEDVLEADNLMDIMNSPVVLNLVDQPRFFDKAAEVISELSPKSESDE